MGHFPSVSSTHTRVLKPTVPKHRAAWFIDRHPPPPTRPRGRPYPLASLGLRCLPWLLLSARTPHLRAALLLSFGRSMLPPSYWAEAILGPPTLCAPASPTAPSTVLWSNQHHLEVTNGTLLLAGPTNYALDHWSTPSPTCTSAPLPPPWRANSGEFPSYPTPKTG
jgi:hypothetical protein